MKFKKISLWLFIVAIISVAIGWGEWQKAPVTGERILAQAKGPAIILFKGDNSGECRAIYKIIDDAELKYGDNINFVRTGWSDDNPLIKKYQILFLPTVIFVDKNNAEVKRIVGEGAAIEQKLETALEQMGNLLGQ